MTIEPTIDLQPGAAEKTKKQAAYDLIKEQIISHQLKPGTVLVERKLCSLINISRTPVREAIQQLTAEGMVVNIAPKGSMVSEIRYEDIARIYDVREYLEGLGARLASMCITSEQIAPLRDYIERMKVFIDQEDFVSLFALDHLLHKTILEYSKNDVLINIYKTNLEAQSKRITHLNGGQSGLIHESHKYHIRLVDALEAGDPDESERLIREHIRGSKERLLRTYLPNSL